MHQTTKPSHYQQQIGHIKELHLIDQDPVVPHDYKAQEDHLANLQNGASIVSFGKGTSNAKKTAAVQKPVIEKPSQIVDVLPLLDSPIHNDEAPAEAEQYNQYQQIQQPVAAAATVQNVVKTAAVKSAPGVPKPLKAAVQTPKKVAAAVNYQKPDETKLVPKKVTADYNSQKKSTIDIIHRNAGLRVAPLDLDVLNRYHDYFHHTTRQPKQGLPTITPFPRHL